MKKKLTGADPSELRAQVRARVNEIAVFANEKDDERAHVAEDDLFEEVLGKIARGCADPKSLASEVLKSKKIVFSRWCA